MRTITSVLALLVAVMLALASPAFAGPCSCPGCPCGVPAVVPAIAPRMTFHALHPVRAYRPSQVLRDHKGRILPGRPRPILSAPLFAPSCPDGTCPR